MAGKLLFGSGFRRMLIGELVIRHFDEALAKAQGTEATWAVIRDTAKELGFDQVEMTLGGEQFQARFRKGEAAAEWTANVPVSNGDYVRLTRPFDAPTHQAAMGPFLDAVRKGLVQKKIAMDGGRRAMAAGA